MARSPSASEARTGWKSTKIIWGRAVVGFLVIQFMCADGFCDKLSPVRKLDTICVSFRSWPANGCEQEQIHGKEDFPSCVNMN